jgi:hypothetical protein
MYPGGGQNQGYGQGAPPPSSDQPGRIELNLSFNPTQLFLHGITPRVTVNRHPVAARWGRMGFDMPPGNHHVFCAFPYLFSDSAGSANMVVPVYPGHITVVSYEAPFIVFMSGSMRIVNTVPMMQYGP